MTDNEILAALDSAVANPRVRDHVATALPELESRLRIDPAAIMSWEPIPLDIMVVGFPTRFVRVGSSSSARALRPEPSGIRTVTNG